MQLAKYKKEYLKKGIVVIPNVFTAKEMDMLKKHAYKADMSLTTARGYKHKVEETAKNKRSLIFFPALADEYIDAIRTDERLVEIVKYFMGDNVKQVNNQIYFREKGDEDEFAWHQDIVFRQPRYRFPEILDDATNYVQTIIAVDDLKIDNGAIEFIEGSHLEGEQEITSSSVVTKMLRHFERRGLEGVKYTAPKGSVLLWTLLTVHGSEMNVSDDDRMTYMNGFAKADNCLDYPYYLKNGKLVDLIGEHVP